VGGLLHVDDAWLSNVHMELAALLYSTGLVPREQCPDRPGPDFSVPRCTFDPALGFVVMDARGIRISLDRLPDEFEWSIIVGPGDLGGTTLSGVVPPVTTYRPNMPGDYLFGVRVRVWGEDWGAVAACGPRVHVD
jgi:hypothetical protein